MRVSTLFPIAVHSLVVIAVFSGNGNVPPDLQDQLPKRKVTSEFVAGSTGSNPVIIRNILGRMKKAGYISIAPGKGGTTLAKPAKEITLWDIYRTVEEGHAEDIFKFHNGMSEACPVGGNIRRILSGHFDRAAFAMRAALDETSLDQVLEEFYAAMQE